MESDEINLENTNWTKATKILIFFFCVRIIILISYLIFYYFFDILSIGVNDFFLINGLIELIILTFMLFLFLRKKIYVIGILFFLILFTLFDFFISSLYDYKIFSYWRNINYFFIFFYFILASFSVFYEYKKRKNSLNFKEVFLFSFFLAGLIFTVQNIAIYSFGYYSQRIKKGSELGASERSFSFLKELNLNPKEIIYFSMYELAGEGLDVKVFFTIENFYFYTFENYKKKVSDSEITEFNYPIKKIKKLNFIKSNEFYSLSSLDITLDDDREFTIYLPNHFSIDEDFYNKLVGLIDRNRNTKKINPIRQKK